MKTTDLDSIKRQALEILLSGKELTNLDGYHLWNTLNLRNRISELRTKDGYAIQRELVRNEESGKQYCKYWIKAEDIMKYNQQKQEAI